MSPAATRQPRVAAVDDTAAEPPVMTGGENLASFIDENSLAGQIQKASLQNRVETKPFRQYQKRVIEKAGVPNTQQTREMASNVCGATARLSFVPDDKIKIDDGKGGETTEYELQIVKTAAWAESQLNSEAVWTVSAQKLARAALDLRKDDPDGSKGIAWVNDTREDEGDVLDQ